MKSVVRFAPILCSVLFITGCPVQAVDSKGSTDIASVGPSSEVTDDESQTALTFSQRSNAHKNTPTAIPTVTSTVVVVPTQTASATPTPSATATAAPTAAPTASVTPTPTTTSSGTGIGQGTTPAPAQTATPSPTATATSSPTVIASATPTSSVTPSPTPTTTSVGTGIGAGTTPTPTQTGTPEPAFTPTPSPTATATASPTATPTAAPICVETAVQVAPVSAGSVVALNKCTLASPGMVTYFNLVPGDNAPSFVGNVYSGGPTMYYASAAETATYRARVYIVNYNNRAQSQLIADFVVIGSNEFAADGNELVGQTKGVKCQAYDYNGATLAAGNVADLTKAGDIAMANFDLPTRNFIGNLPGTSLNNRFRIECDAYVVAPSAGTYQFRITSDDGAILYVDGAKVVDNDGTRSAPATKTSTNKTLTAGRHAIHLSYMQGAGPSLTLQLFWKVPNDVMTIIHANAIVQ